MDTPHKPHTGPWVPPEDLAQNEAYLGQRLLYNRSDQTEVTLLDVVTGDTAKKILRRAFGGFALILVAGLILEALGGLTSSSRSSDESSFALFGTLLAFGWLAMNLFVPRREPLGDWNLVLGKQHKLADTAYAAVYRSLKQEHRIPADIGVRRVRVGGPASGVRNYLQVRLGKYAVHVSVFPFGADLYLGWTLWRTDVPIAVVLRWLKLSTRRDPGYTCMVEIEPVKALRDAVHDGMRAGIEAVRIGEAVPLRETFGDGLRIESDDTAGPAQPVSHWLTVAAAVPVYSTENGAEQGRATPGKSYELVDETADGLLVRDTSGVIALLRDTSGVRWS
ncbi:hypothetical protein EV193_103435 [Herbihabitans rhizosphaerae]|uniref:Uncharacterized protein n=1 Tax=Herbihabitans rhizosphaerae TaxID=1872711 RepID=A0A4Q7KWY5_9PSEU|nr:hypothetical protein [Herbihabitans rhizosphaerae]RZS41116.1 hypothetical protein EV193_103435 [Herbihabitans rhizosphaerae]